MATLTFDWRKHGAWSATLPKTELHNIMAVALKHGFTMRVAGQHWDR